MVFTVAEIADLIRLPHVERAAIVERLRHWGKEGLLAPVGQRNPGTGRPNAYEVTAVYDAAILNTLADSGLPIGRLRHIGVTLSAAERARTAWAKKRSPKLELEVADFGTPDHQGGRYAVFLHDGDKRDHLGKGMHPRAEMSYSVNVSRLFARIETRMKEQGGSK
jgi:hypothetical protein